MFCVRFVFCILCFVFYVLCFMFCVLMFCCFVFCCFVCCVLCAQVADIMSRYERKGYKLVGAKMVQPTKKFAEQHYSDLKGKPFFNGLTDFLSSGPVFAMVSERFSCS